MRINHSVNSNSRNRIFFISPFLKFIISAAPETRTLNLLFTRQLRYQLRQNGILKYGISDSNGCPSVYKTAARNLLCWCRKLINNATYSYSLFHDNLSFLIFLIRTDRIELPLSPYQRDFLLLKRCSRARRGSRNLIYCLESSRDNRYTIRTLSPLPDLNRSLPAWKADVLTY